MTTRNIDLLVMSQTTYRSPTAIGEYDITVLTDAELDHVAAAGSKLGGSTEGRSLLGSLLTLSA